MVNPISEQKTMTATEKWKKKQRKGMKEEKSPKKQTLGWKKTIIFKEEKLVEKKERHRNGESWRGKEWARH